MKIKSYKIVEVGEPDITLKYAEDTFNELLAFQGYGFCLGYDAEVEVKDKGKMPIGKLVGGEYIKAPALGIDYKWVKVTHILPQGKKKVSKITLNDGTQIICTKDHKFLCSDKRKHSIAEIISNNFSASPDEELWFYCEDDYKYLISCVDLDEEMPVMDITVDSDEHLFYANGIATSNCKAHATSYAVYSAVQLWLQEHYFLEYMATLMTHVDRAKEKKGVAMLDERVMYCLRHGVSVLYPDVNRSTTRWEIIDGAKLLAPLANIKGFSVADTELIMENRPYRDIKDFLDKTQFGKGKVEALLFAGALSKFGDVTTLYNWYYNDYCNKDKKKNESVDFFDFGDDFSIKEKKNEKSFTKEELQDKQYEMNGFQVDENLIIKYHRIYEEGLKYFTKDDCKTKIYRIKEAITAPVASTWVLGKIRSIQMDKWQNYQVTLTDGIDFYTFKLKNQDYNSSCFRRNSVCVFPFYKEVEKDGDEIISIGTMFYSRYNAEKKDIFKIE